MFSTSKTLFFLIFLLLQTSNTSSSKFLSKDLLQFFGDFLEPDSAQKMRETSKQWSSLKIYENILPNESKVAVFRNVNTEEIVWVGETMPNHEVLVSHLRRNDSAKWNDVFLWLHANKCENLLFTNKVFLKALMLEIAENVDVTLNGLWSPLIIAAAFDDNDSILALIKRDANVNQPNAYGYTTLHYAAMWGNIDTCANLLEYDANINVADHHGDTPLMEAAIFGKTNAYEFLIKKGADQTPINNDGETAAQLARFRQKYPF